MNCSFRGGPTKQKTRLKSTKIQDLFGFFTAYQHVHLFSLRDVDLHSGFVFPSEAETMSNLAIPVALHTYS